MPWKESSVVDERLRFVEDVYRGVASMSELCARYGISRTTGYETLGRHAAHGAAGLADRSHRPARCPHAVPAEVVVPSPAPTRPLASGFRRLPYI